MRPPRRQAPHDRAARTRVIDAYLMDEDWCLVAAHNGIPESTARRLVNHGRIDPLPRGGARAARTRMTPDMKDALEVYLDEDCTYTLQEMCDMLLIDFGVRVSTSTVSRYLCGALYTIKKTRIEPVTCNNEVNVEKRKIFADKLLKHMQDGDYIIYFDETNFNLYCKRSQGRAKKGQRAVATLPPSKGPNLRVQCAVSSAGGVIHSKLHRGSIKMQQNADFVDEIYDVAKDSAIFKEHYEGKKIVIVLDNAPAHNQTEKRVQGGDDLVILRLGPYSPMCNPIEGCFSVFKAKTKMFLRMHQDEMFNLLPDMDMTLTEQRMRLLEHAAEYGIRFITSVIVTSMALHCMTALNAASRIEPMQYGV